MCRSCRRYKYHIKDRSGDKESGNNEEDGSSPPKVRGDLPGGKVEYFEKSVVRHRDVVGLVMRIDDLVPNVRHPQAGNQQG